MWGKDKWPPHHIIQYYGPATWAQDGCRSYRTPIYMLNRIIRLQAAPEIITKETAPAVELLARQESQRRSAVIRNRLALDDLLAGGGGVCGRFNQTDCCLRMDDNGKAPTAIATNTRKIAHVPVQSWDPSASLEADSPLSVALRP